MAATACATKRWKELPKILKRMTAMDLEVIYKKDGMLAISKPAGMPVHSGPGMGKSVLDFMDEFQEIHSLGQAPKLVHRLDKTSSGLLLLAYSDDMAKKLSELFTDRKINKTYYGVTRGVPSTVSGVIADPICEAVIGHDKRHRMATVSDLENESSMFPAPNRQPKKAYTGYRVLDNNKNSCALVEFVAKTGLKHQIRLHSASSLGCPILGDHKFSSISEGVQVLPLRLMQMLNIRALKPKNPKQKPHIQVWQRALIPLHLFAQSVEIPEIRKNGKVLQIKAPMPEYFADTLMKCNLHPKRQFMIEQEEKRYSQR